jgi:hypothetical protein
VIALSGVFEKSLLNDLKNLKYQLFCVPYQLRFPVIFDRRLALKQAHPESG